MKRLIILCLGGMLGVAATATEWPEVSEEALAELGSTYGTPQAGGFVFIDGRYVAPPYTVTRRGNGLFINRVQIDQPAAWPTLAAQAEPPKKALDADGDFEEVAPAANAPAEGEGGAAPAAPAAVKAVKSIDDLFADDEVPAAAPVPAAPPVPAVSAAAAPVPPLAEQESPDDVKRQKDELRASLDNQRKGYELALARGEVFFFGQRHSRLNGTYGTARALMGVLPKALRQAQSPQELMQRLNQGGVYFIDLPICVALFRNRLTFPLLEERLRRIEEAEEIEAARRSQAQLR